MEKPTNPLDTLLQGLANQGNAQETTEESQVETEVQEEVENSDSEESNEIESSSQEEEAEKPTTVESTKKDTENEISDWDLESESTQEEPTSNVIQELGTELGLPIKDKKSIVEEFKRLKEKSEHLEKTLADSKSQKPFANDMLEKANDIAKNGGDYLAYLKVSDVNYDTIPNDSLIAHAYGQDFENEEELNDFLGSKSETEKKILANQIRRNLKETQAAQQREIEQAVIQKKRTLDEGLTKHLESIDKIHDLKLSPAHKKEIYSQIETGQLINDIFYKKDGTYNFEAMTKIAFFHKYGDKVINHLTSKAVNQTKREEFKKISNVEVTKKSSPVVDTTKKSGVEAYLDQLKSKHKR